jgi:hypothetical protein
MLYIISFYTSIFYFFGIYGLAEFAVPGDAELVSVTSHTCLPFTDGAVSEAAKAAMFCLPIVRVAVTPSELSADPGSTPSGHSPLSNAS